MLTQVIETLARVIDFVGIGIIFWGVAAGLVDLVSAKLRPSKAPDPFQAITRVRCKVGTYMLLGLEILIASDIAETVIEPTYERVVLLGAIVAIRTVLSFFLGRELEAIATQP